MTNNSKLFHTNNVGYPLYEGKMINMFTHKYAKPRYWIDKEEGCNVLETKEINRMKRLNKNSKQKPRIDSDEYRLVWRTITNSTNERTLISTILQKNIFLGHSLNYLNPLNFNGEKYVRNISYSETFFLCGIFNSFVVDFILRHKVATNLTIFYLMEIPIPLYDKNNPHHIKLMENTAKLICISNEYDDLRNQMGITEFVIEQNMRLVLESQINALSAKIYGLTKEDLELILKNFHIVDEKFKKLTLEEFDKLI